MRIVEIQSTIHLYIANFYLFLIWDKSKIYEKQLSNELEDYILDNKYIKMFINFCNNSDEYDDDYDPNDILYTLRILSSFGI